MLVIHENQALRIPNVESECQVFGESMSRVMYTYGTTLRTLFEGTRSECETFIENLKPSEDPGYVNIVDD